MNNTKQVYLFYKYDQESIKLTKETISYNINNKAKTLQLDDIIDIELVLIGSVNAGYWKLINIKTKSNFFKQALYLNEIEDIENLFDTFNNLYSNKIKEPLDYARYKRFVKDEKSFYKFTFYSWIILLALLLIPFFFLVLHSGLRTQSHNYQYTSYDKNNTLHIHETKTILCPKKFELINLTNNNSYIYKYECLIGRKMILIYEKELSKEDAINFKFEKNIISTKDMFYYLVGSI